MNKKDLEKVINELINIEPNKIKKHTVVINDDKPIGVSTYEIRGSIW